MRSSIVYGGCTVEFDFTGVNIDPFDVSQITLSTLEKIMSVLTTDLNEIKTKLAQLKQNNNDLTAEVADLAGKVDAANVALATAQANAIAPEDVQLIADIKTLLA